MIHKEKKSYTSNFKSLINFRLPIYIYNPNFYHVSLLSVLKADNMKSIRTNKDCKAKFANPNEDCKTKLIC